MSAARSRRRSSALPGRYAAWCMAVPSPSRSHTAAIFRAIALVVAVAPLSILAAGSAGFALPRLGPDAGLAVDEVGRLFGIAFVARPAPPRPGRPGPAGRRARRRMPSGHRGIDGPPLPRPAPAPPAAAGGGRGGDARQPPQGVGSAGRHPARSDQEPARAGGPPPAPPVRPPLPRRAPHGSRGRVRALGPPHAGRAAPARRGAG